MEIEPTYRELDRKLKQRNEAATSNQIHILNPDVIYADLLELDYLVGDLVDDLPAIFQEIKPDHYQGRRPPEKSYEESILNAELFAFKWTSRVFGCDMYFKFAIKGGIFWIVSLHRDKR